MVHAAWTWRDSCSCFCLAKFCPVYSDIEGVIELLSRPVKNHTREQPKFAWVLQQKLKSNLFRISSKRGGGASRHLLDSIAFTFTMCDIPVVHNKDKEHVLAKYGCLKDVADYSNV